MYYVYLLSHFSPEHLNSSGNNYNIVGIKGNKPHHFKNEVKKLVDKIEMEIVGKEFVRKHDHWEYHRRGKNYIAHITGLNDEYGFAREFLERSKLGKETFFKAEDFKVGEIYEIVSIYYSGSGNPSANVKDFYICTKKNGKLEFEKRSNDEVIIRFSEDNNEDEKLELLAKELITAAGSKEKALKLLKSLEDE